ncbi:MAG: hypothetical protein ABIT01_08545 [Thermoanaerobaculia bacterium]
MKRTQALSCLLFVSLFSRGAIAQDSAVLEFEPKVGAIGSRVLIKSSLAEGAVVQFGPRTVPVRRESRGASFVIPPGSATSFIEVKKNNRSVAKSAVPFVVSGTSLVATPKLIGLKEAIDVFGYNEGRPEGGEKPENRTRSILKLDDQEILTIGQSAPTSMGPSVDMQDAGSAATRSMGAPGFIITAKPPKKKLPAPTPSPSE